MTLVVVVAAAATYYVSNQQVKTYTSAAELYVGQSSLQTALSQTGAAGQTDRTVVDDAGLMQSPAVLAQVRHDLGLRVPPAALRGAVQATPSSGSDFMVITSRSAHRALAAQLANAFAKAFIEVRNGNVVRDARAALAAAQQRARALPNNASSQSARLALRDQISTLEGVIVTPPSSGQIVSPAVPASGPDNASPVRDAVFAAVIALVMGIIVSYLLSRGDQHVRRLDDLEGLYGLPVLSTVPSVRRSAMRAAGSGRAVPAVREAVRGLRVNLDVARSRSAAQVLLFTSALPGEGKSTVVRQLALTYQEAGRRVAVVEADMRTPVMAERFGLQAAPGLSEALSGGDLLVQHVTEEGVGGSRELTLSVGGDGEHARSGGGGRFATQGLAASTGSHREQAVASEPGGDQDAIHPGELGVVVAGHVSEDPTVLVTSPRLDLVLAALVREYDIVLIDSPPLLPVSDSIALIGQSDAVVLVVRSGVATRTAARRVQRTLDRVAGSHDVLVLGAVVNDVSDELAGELKAYQRGASQPVGQSAA